MIDARFIKKVEAISIFKVDISYLERNYQYQCLAYQPIIVSKLYNNSVTFPIRTR